MFDIESLTIRPFQPGDRGMVTEFFDQMGGETRALFNRGDGNRRSAMGYFDGLDGDDTARFAAVDPDGAMAGYVFLWEIGKLTPWLGIAVREEWKGRRLGGVLLEYAANWARERGCGGILLTTAQGNLRGQALYERCGYERLGCHTSGEVLYLLRFQR